MASACQPVQLASGGAPFDLAVDATNVYWTDFGDNTVKACAIAGCPGGPTLFGSMLASPIGIAANANLLAWADHGSGALGDVTVCTGGTCAPDVKYAAPGAWGVAVDATTVYWTQPALGRVLSAAGGAPAVLLASIAPSTPQGIAVDATQVYWTTGGTGTVMSCPLAGCAGNPTTLATGLPGPQGIAVDSTSVYWVNQTAGTVMKCATAGCGAAPTLLATGPGTPSSIALDTTSVYWATAGGGTVMKCPLGGGGSTTIASGLSNAAAVAVDATRIFWIDGGSGKVMKLAK